MTRAFLIGHPRCGTTSLWEALKNIGDISVPFERKEFRYFDNNYHWPLTTYESQFPQDEDKKIFLDCNVAYSYVNFTARRIHYHYPDAKIIQVVREPYQRIYSWWKLFHNMRYGREPRGFVDFAHECMVRYNPDRFEYEGNWLPYLDQAGNSYKPFIFESGAYGRTYVRFVELFDFDNVLLLRFEDLIKAPYESLDIILNFLGSEWVFNRNLKLPDKGIDDDWPSKDRRGVAQPLGPSVEKAMRREVRDFFKTEMRYLEQASGLDFKEYYVDSD